MSGPQHYDTLRRAATALREAAEAATPGPWERGTEIGHFAEFGYHLTYTDVEPSVCGGIEVGDAAYIAMVDPVVGAKLADLLDAIDRAARLSGVAAEHPDALSIRDKAAALARAVLARKEA